MSYELCNRLIINFLKTTEILKAGNMNAHFLFYIGLSFLLMHEMDAIRCKEWRIFPFLSALNDDKGFKIFIFAHIPLFYVLFHFLYLTDGNTAFIQGLNIFFIVHTVLHLLLLKHPKNEFKDWVSWSIIIGNGLSGILYLTFSQ